MKKYLLVAHLLLLVLIPIIILGFLLGYAKATGPAPSLIKDINQTGGSSPFALTNVNGILYFFANDGMHGLELWKSDGTLTGTKLVSDINPTGNGVIPSYTFLPAAISDTLYFTANDGAHGFELWKTDGTITGTTIVSDIYLGINNSYPMLFAKLNDALFFAAANASNGTELWRSDGTVTGTVLITDITLGPFSALASTSSLQSVNGTLYFSAEASEGFWKSDGTSAGTVLVKKIESSTMPGPTYERFHAVNGAIYFVGCGIPCTPNGGLWKSDGTADGTVLVKDLYITELRAVENTLYLSAHDKTPASDLELWKSDGTPTGTMIIKNINPTGSSSPNTLTSYNTLLFFSADDGTNGRELWKSDGTDAGTVMIKDINPGSGGSSPSQMTEVNGILYFSADNGTSGVELWKSDGTLTGTIMVGDINSGAGDSLDSAWLTESGGNLYFFADDGTNGTELWKLINSTSSPSLTITKTVNPVSLVTPDQTLTYTIVISNQGGAVANDVLISDTFPASITGVGLITTATIPAGQSVIFILTGTVINNVIDGTVITNTAFYSHVSSKGQANAASTVQNRVSNFWTDLPFILKD